jgi:[ribosomal protein S18]-alanine N-acetyltransferase
MTVIEEIIIRAMSIADLEDVIKIEQLCYSPPWKKEHFIHEIHSPVSFPFVLTVKDVVAGYLCLMSLFEEAQIMNITVSGQYRGKGLAQKLIEFAVKTAVEKGAENLVLEVRESNFAAISLYEKNGFVRYFVRKKYYEGLEDALMMEKSLKKQVQE